ncbi:unnamed protein product [Amaranthus hypochondriacus]
MARLNGVRSFEEKENKKKRKKMVGSKKRHMKKEKREEMGMVGDPLKVLGEDIMMKIMGKMDAYSLARSLVVSNSWFSLASSDSLWSPLVCHLYSSSSFLFVFLRDI